eukprot:TRINITY_DN34765_c0_g1_i1.p1 TRINITY_DN34765_c0_g1~~TRINITY_DN34765_c0_g1_i1.p1  ORF type:complete len:560 (+),score=101.55 TRINITY_DN34765_c0_g1_i1:121-1680(+)
MEGHMSSSVFSAWGTSHGLAKARPATPPPSSSLDLAPRMENSPASTGLVGYTSAASSVRLESSQDAMETTKPVLGSHTAARRTGSNPASARRQLSAFSSSMRTGSVSITEGNQHLALGRGSPAGSEALELRITSQLKQAQQQANTIRDAALAQVNSKLATMDQHQRRIDRSVAEIGGTCRGLSDELQQLIRKVNQLDSRMLEQKRHLEEDFRTKIADLEQTHWEHSSALRLSQGQGEDHKKTVEKKVNQLQLLVEDRFSNTNQDRHEEINDLTRRLADLEMHVSHQTAALELASSHRSLAKAANEDEGAPIGGNSDAFNRLTQRVEHLMQDSQDVHTQLSMTEERVNSLRTRLDTHDGNHRKLTDRVEGFDWNTRLKDTNNRVDDAQQKQLAQLEHLERLAARLESHENTVKEHAEKFANFDVIQEQNINIQGDGGDFEDSDMLASRLFDIDTRVQKLAMSVEALEGMSGFDSPNRVDGPQMQGLLNALSQVAPKMRDMNGDIDLLKAEVAKIRSEIEG